MIKNFSRKVLIFIIPLFIFTSCLSTLQLISQETPLDLIPKNKNMGGYSFVIPDNFRLVSNQSLIFRYNGDVRAYLVYAGKASTVQLINFFTEYMPEKGWMSDFASVSEEGTLAFKKRGRLIIIKITPDVAGVSYLRILLTK